MWHILNPSFCLAKTLIMSNVASLEDRLVLFFYIEGSEIFEYIKSRSLLDTLKTLLNCMSPNPDNISKKLLKRILLEGTIYPRSEHRCHDTSGILKLPQTKMVSCKDINSNTSPIILACSKYTSISEFGGI